MIVTYKQAKQLKKLGYNRECDDIYWNDKSDTEGLGEIEESYGKFDWNSQYDEPCISAPSAHEALQYIREEYNLHGYIDCNASGYYWVICKTNGTFVKDYNYSGTNDGGCWDSFPEAESALLDEILKLIKVNKK